eukprot:679016-Rhodomonas_salina.1
MSSELSGDSGAMARRGWQLALGHGAPRACAACIDRYHDADCGDSNTRIRINGTEREWIAMVRVWFRGVIAGPGAPAA